MQLLTVFLLAITIGHMVDSSPLDLISSEANRFFQTINSWLEDIYSILQSFRERFFPLPSEQDLNGIPQTTLLALRSHFSAHFITNRNSVSDVLINKSNNFNKIKKNLFNKFQRYGLETFLQSCPRDELVNGTTCDNLIGIRPGIYRGTSNDAILIIGAHYDTVFRSPGVNDNGSGSVAVLELARLLHQYRCSLNTTVIFALFDREESGFYGSRAFVNQYLIPIEMETKRLEIKGAYILDMLLSYDPMPGSQITSDFENILPEWTSEVRANENSADFVAIWSRGTSHTDHHLYQCLASQWNNYPRYKLSIMSVPLPQHYNRCLNYSYDIFLRSDHASFWYPKQRSALTIPAVLLTDLGAWRRDTLDKYHNEQDNAQNMLNNSNLEFLKNTIDSLMKTVLMLSQGKCVEDRTT